jgi:hypothetical protein
MYVCMYVPMIESLFHLVVLFTENNDGFQAALGVGLTPVKC